MTELNARRDDSTVDPVCGEALTPEEATASSEHEGRTFYFKHIKCKMLFERDPSRYLREAASTAPQAPPAAPQPAPVAPEPSSVRRILSAGALLLAGGVAGLLIYLGTRGGDRDEALVPAVQGAESDAAQPSLSPAAPAPPPSAAPLAPTTVDAGTGGDQPSALTTDSAPATAPQAAAEEPRYTPAPSTIRRGGHSGTRKKEPAERSGTAAEVNKQLEVGKRAMKDNDLSAAVAAYKRVIELDPRSTEAYAALGIAYRRQGQDTLAVEALMTYLKLAPKASDAERVRKLIEEYSQGEAK